MKKQAKDLKIGDIIYFNEQISIVNKIQIELWNNMCWRAYIYHSNGLSSCITTHWVEVICD